MAKKQAEEQVPHQEKFMQPGAPYATTARPLDMNADREFPVPQRDHAYGEFMTFATPRNTDHED